MDDAEQIINQIVARTTADGGATYNVKRAEMQDLANIWLYPQFPGLTKITPAENLAAELIHFLSDYATVLDNDDLYVGTWINPENDQCYIDVIAYANTKEEALAKAQHLSEDQGRQVVSIYNPSTRQIVNL